MCLFHKLLKDMKSIESVTMCVWRDDVTISLRFLWVIDYFDGVLISCTYVSRPARDISGFYGCLTAVYQHVAYEKTIMQEIPHLPITCYDYQLY